MSYRQDRRCWLAHSYLVVPAGSWRCLTPPGCAFTAGSRASCGSPHAVSSAEDAPADTQQIPIAAMPTSLHPRSLVNIIQYYSFVSLQRIDFSRSTGPTFSCSAESRTETRSPSPQWKAHAYFDLAGGRHARLSPAQQIQLFGTTGNSNLHKYDSTYLRELDQLCDLTSR